MTNYETFILTIGYIAFILAVIGIGGVLTIIAAGIALVGHYPFVCGVGLTERFFKKGNK